MPLPPGNVPLPTGRPGRSRLAVPQPYAAGTTVLGEHLAHQDTGRKEAQVIARGLLDLRSGFRRPVLEFLTSDRGLDVLLESESERRFHMALDAGTSGPLSDLLSAIMTYEMFARVLQDAFDDCLYEMSGGTEIEDYTTIDYEMVRISMRTNQMEEEERKKLIERINEYTDKNFSQFKVDITGFDNLVHEVTERITMTQIHSFGLAFLVILGFMFLLFGLRGGLLSIIPNVFPIVFVLGLMGYAGFHLNIATAIIASIAIGIVVDDTIHYFTHFKYEFQESGERKTAMKKV